MIYINPISNFSAAAGKNQTVSKNPVFLKSRPAEDRTEFKNEGKAAQMSAVSFTSKGDFKPAEKRFFKFINEYFSRLKKEQQTTVSKQINSKTDSNVAVKIKDTSGKSVSYNPETEQIFNNKSFDDASLKLNLQSPASIKYARKLLAEKLETCKEFYGQGFKPVDKIIKLPDGTSARIVFEGLEYDIALDGRILHKALNYIKNPLKAKYSGSAKNIFDLKKGELLTMRQV